MERIRFSGISIRNIGPFGDLTINFCKPVRDDEAEIHILTGENGTGKSSVLYSLTSGIIPLSQLISKRLNFKNADLPKIIIGIESQDPNIGNTALEIKYDQKEGKSMGASSTGYPLFPNADYYETDQYYEEKGPFPFPVFAFSSYRKISNPKTNNVDVVTNNPFSGGVSFASTEYSDKLLSWVGRIKSKEAFAKAKANEKQAELIASPLEIITDFIEEITGQKAEFGINEITLVSFLSIDNQKIDFDILPDGLKSIISWISDLLMRLDSIAWTTNEPVTQRNFILLLDEIEVHLHPAWQRKILPVIQKLFKNSQIFVSTHSPFVINSVDGAWIYKFKKEGQYSVLDGAPVLSEDGKSYRLILDEIFGINEDFGVEVEADLKKFYAFKDHILKDELSVANEDFMKLANHLSKQSTELNTIIGMELRQLNRLKGLTVSS